MIRRGKGDELADLFVTAEFGDVVIRQRAATLGPPDEVDLFGSGGREDTVNEAGDGLRRDADITGIGEVWQQLEPVEVGGCLLYTSPSPRDLSTSRMPSSA